jgi:hypothetical protein
MLSANDYKLFENFNVSAIKTFLNTQIQGYTNATCVCLSLSHENKILCGAHKLLSRAHELLCREHEVLSRAREIIKL